MITTTTIFYFYIICSLITNIWLVAWVYGNWKKHVRVAKKKPEKYEEYDSLDQDEKDFWGIK